MAVLALALSHLRVVDPVARYLMFTIGLFYVIDLCEMFVHENRDNFLIELIIYFSSAVIGGLVLWGGRRRQGNRNPSDLSKPYLNTGFGFEVKNSSKKE